MSIAMQRLKSCSVDVEHVGTKAGRVVGRLVRTRGVGSFDGPTEGDWIGGFVGLEVGCNVPWHDPTISQSSLQSELIDEPGLNIFDPHERLMHL